MQRPRRSGGRRWRYLVLTGLLIGVYCYWALNRSLPPIKPSVNPAIIQKQAAAGNLAWPAQGQSALGIVDSNILETRGTQKPVPTASTAKLITALVVLQDKPLSTGEQGPTITLGPKDVAIYNKYFIEDGSLVKISAGEKISEYKVLQTMMLPSANNMADSLAIWTFGSLKNYAAVANKYLAAQGLGETHVGSDASGFAPDSTSTAGDLVKIGELAMSNPVLAQIVGQSSASGIPVAGNIKNVNSLLGAYNIVGVKTGNTEQAGGVYISASHVTVNGKEVTIVTAVTGSKTLIQAMKNSIPLIKSAQTNFKPVTVVAAGSTVGVYNLPWGGNVNVIADKDLILEGWGGSTISAQTNLGDITTDYNAGDIVGSVTTAKSATSDRLSVPVKIQTAPTTPSGWWRISHPLN